ncbi:MAG: hypothetical protein AB8B99_07570 [Phormidesmis sp.]
MPFLKLPVATSRRSRKLRLETGIASASLGAVGIALSLSAPAQALEPDSVTVPDRGLSDPPVTLESLQAGARRAQLERLRRAQARLDQPATPSAPVLSNAATRNLSVSDRANGIYLYGEQPVHDQPGTAYFVFETNAGNVTGAFYTASSSFDCAQGRINSNNIQLTITDSYSQDSYSYALSRIPATTQVASQQSVTLPMDIEGFHPLPVRTSDRTILATCQTQY